MFSGSRYRLPGPALAIVVTGLATLLAHPVPGIAQTTLPQLPQVFLDTTYVPPTGSVINVPAGGDFQGALNSATRGTTIVLQAGATYTGNFTLPAKSGSGWIYIQSSALSSLPAPGTRVAPGNASAMATIVTPNSSAPITTASGASFYRLVGLEITGTLVDQSYEIATALVSLTSGTDVTIDRCYVHGQPGGAYRDGVLLNNARGAIIDSYIADIHVGPDESHGILGWNGPGPFKVVNNYIEASAINLLFGGADPSVTNLVPSDIEVRKNWMRKPWSWWSQSSSYGGIHWTVKNIFELKNAQRVLIDGNLLENCWVDPNAAFGQQGANAFVLTTRNQGGGCPWCVVQDITITNNIARHVGQGIGMMGNEGAGAHRFLIRNNLLDDVSGVTYGPGANGRAFQETGGLTDLTVDHTTAFQDGAVVYDQDVPLAYTNNLTNWGGGAPTAYGPNAGFAGGTVPANYASFLANVIIGGTASGLPTGNFFPAVASVVGFTSYSTGNYTLTSTSPYHNAATDGTDVGANYAAITAATTGTTPPPSSGPYLGVPVAIPGTVQASFFDLGGEGVGYHKVTPAYNTLLRPTEGVSIYSPSAGTYAVNNFATSEWLAYTASVAQAGTYQVAILASNNNWSPTPAWHLEVDGVNVTGSVSVPSTGSWSTYQSVTATKTFSLSAGQHVLRLVSDQQYFNVESLQVSVRAKADIGVFRPSTGTWYILLSSTGALQQIQWGAAGDQPLSP